MADGSGGGRHKGTAAGGDGVEQGGVAAERATPQVDAGELQGAQSGGGGAEIGGGEQVASAEVDAVACSVGNDRQAGKWRRCSRWRCQTRNASP